MRAREVSVGSAVVAAGVATVVVAMPFVGDFTSFVLALVVIQSIAVLSLNLLMGYAGQVSLGQAAFVGVGAFGAAEAARAGAPFPVPILVAIIVGAAIAAIVGLPSLRIRGFQVAATTLAFGLVAERLLFVRPWDAEAGTGLGIDRPVALVGGRAFLLVAIAGLLVTLAADGAIRSSRIGRAFFAVRDREDTAAARGIDVGRTKLLAYALSGAIAGLAGGLFAYLLERATPESFTVFVSLGLVAAVVVGGLGSWSGAIAAGVVFAGLPELLRPAAGYAPLGGAALLLIVPIIRPEGLGWLLERRLRIGPARRAAEARPTAVQRPLSLAMPVRTVLEVRGVSVSFGGVEALADVSMDVRRGEMLGLIGPNGAGKSTLFDVLSGSISPDTGSVRYRGRELTRMAAHERARLGIARTFQQVGLSTGSSVRDNILVALHDLARYPISSALVRAPHVRRIERELAARADEVLSSLGLSDVAGAKVGALPHGTRRLAEVAATLATEPDLLLLDEPFAGAGPHESEALVETLMALRERLGLTIVVIEHDVPLVARMCDHVVVLDRGRVLAQGSGATIRSDPDVTAVYVGAPAPARRAADG